MDDHSNKVPLHCFLESEFVLVRIDNCWDLTSIYDPLELAFKDLVESVLLDIVNDAESDLLSLGVNDGEQGIVNDVRLRETEGVVVDADVKDPVNRVPNWKRSSHEC